MAESDTCAFGGTGKGDLVLTVIGAREVVVGIGGGGHKGAGVGTVGDVAHLHGAAAAVGVALGAVPEAHLEAADVVLEGRQQHEVAGGIGIVEAQAVRAIVGIVIIDLHEVAAGAVDGREVCPAGRHLVGSMVLEAFGPRQGGDAGTVGGEERCDGAGTRAVVAVGNHTDRVGGCRREVGERVTRVAYSGAVHYGGALLQVVGVVAHLGGVDNGDGGLVGGHAGDVHLRRRHAVGQHHEGEVVNVGGIAPRRGNSDADGRMTGVVGQVAERLLHQLPIAGAGAGAYNALQGHEGRGVGRVGHVAHAHADAGTGLEHEAEQGTTQVFDGGRDEELRLVAVAGIEVQAVGAAVGIG